MVDEIRPFSIYPMCYLPCYLDCLLDVTSPLNLLQPHNQVILRTKLTEHHKYNYPYSQASPLPQESSFLLPEFWSAGPNWLTIGLVKEFPSQ